MLKVIEIYNYVLKKYNIDRIKLKIDFNIITKQYIRSINE